MEPTLEHGPASGREADFCLRMKEAARDAGDRCDSDITALAKQIGEWLTSLRFLK